MADAADRRVTRSSRAVVVGRGMPTRTDPAQAAFRRVEHLALAEITIASAVYKTAAAYPSSRAAQHLLRRYQKRLARR